MDPFFGKQWWSRMVNFVLKALKELLVNYGLYIAVRAAKKRHFPE